MRRGIAVVFGVLVACAASAQLPKSGEITKGASNLPKARTGWASMGAADEKTNADGIKEALGVGTERAVESLAKVNGYFGYEAVKILMPSSLERVAKVARIAGFQTQVDEFVLGMNRAAEAAAPQAARYFSDAIRDMTLEDVRGILTGGETAATDFFRRKTHDKIYIAFRPIVSQKVGEVGAIRVYNDMMRRYESLPIASRQSLDLADYVTNKALDGLFYMVGVEEKYIRTNPAARTTELLRAVFGK